MFHKQPRVLAAVNAEENRECFSFSRAISRHHVPCTLENQQTVVKVPPIDTTADQAAPHHDNSII